jgi:ABC-2 type transport system permease protein
MITDAFGAELTKTLRHRTTLIWGFLISPIAGFALGMMGLGVQSTVNGVVVTHVKPFAAALISGAAAVQNPFWGLFWLLGGAMIFAGDYRWATFRYVLVRNSRLAILGAKLAVFALLGAVSLVLFGLGEVIVAAVASQRGGSVIPEEGPSLAAAALAYLAAVLRLTSIGALLALAAVVSRSVVGTIISVMVGLIALAALEFRVQLQGPAWLTPGLPGHAVSALLSGYPTQSLAALACLVGWVAVPAAVAGWLFSRQDLSRE